MHIPSVSLCRLQVLELPVKGDKIIDFAWEPHGTRFAVLHGDTQRPSLSLYEMKDMKNTVRGVQLVATQANKQVNCLHWSPQVSSHTPCTMSSCLSDSGCGLKQRLVPLADAQP